MSLAPATTSYLDHAATTPMVPEAIAAMQDAMLEGGNPSSLHGSGRRARRRVEEARELIAQRIGARPSEVVFLSGGTEADNLAVKGLYWSRHRSDPARRRAVASAIEHHAVLDSLAWLEKSEGAVVDLVGVDAVGRVDVDALRATLERDPSDVALISCMWANNELGTVQPIPEIVALAREHGIPVHSDAVQALAHLPVDFAASGLDAMSLASHKVGGPTGVGALVARRELEAVPLVHGGGQERDLRSGTLNTAAIAAFAVAVDLAVTRREDESARLEALRRRLVEGLRQAVPEAVVNGDPEPGPQSRLPHVVHLTFPGAEGDSLLMLLDAAGIECSTGSACSAGVPQASHVLTAMGLDDLAARGSLRFSMGHTTTAADVDRLLATLPGIYERARAASTAGRR
ncbi:cysteine desulfurase [Mumia sp. zg.B17]|uniref:cysteine desulfurase family protein n=1 Tax=Mumia sp. zg.B17 TaxID=2855446 RepID=UPI001C6ED920|nr:cysteine desulfurase family protein [Mumia sp. zg.B17]MBW9205663.1 cysteine desulfurase [Mumia sp. zg.B17]